MCIDLQALWADMQQECYSASFGAGIGGALIESIDVDRAVLNELIEIACRWGLDPSEYEI